MCFEPQLVQVHILSLVAWHEMNCNFLTCACSSIRHYIVLLCKKKTFWKNFLLQFDRNCPFADGSKRIEANWPRHVRIRRPSFWREILFLMPKLAVLLRGSLCTPNFNSLTVQYVHWLLLVALESNLDHKYIKLKRCKRISFSITFWSKTDSWRSLCAF